VVDSDARPRASAPHSDQVGESLTAYRSAHRKHIRANGWIAGAAVSVMIVGVRAAVPWSVPIRCQWRGKLVYLGAVVLDEKGIAATFDGGACPRPIAHQFVDFRDARAADSRADNKVVWANGWRARAVLSVVIRAKRTAALP
jgi:hypothetical protein